MRPAPPDSAAPPRSPTPLGRLLIALVRAWQQVSALLPPRCRYYPSCSHYAVEAITGHGALRGTLLAAWRLLRCNPLSPGGVDHAPAPRRRRRKDLARV